MKRVHRTWVPFISKGAHSVGLLFCAVVWTGCGDGDWSTPAPIILTDPTTSPRASIAGFVREEGAGFVFNGDQCLIGARVEMIDGPHAGAVSVQTECEPWYDSFPGYYFLDLPFGIPVTLRASAKGYTPTEIRAVPANLPVPSWDARFYTTTILLTKE